MAWGMTFLSITIQPVDPCNEFSLATHVAVGSGIPFAIVVENTAGSVVVGTLWRFGGVAFVFLRAGLITCDHASNPPAPTIAAEVSPIVLFLSKDRRVTVLGGFFAPPGLLYLANRFSFSDM
jgi:hypothetical protein